jgi:DNA-binding transcriptional regulator GbsR (MarR family)
MSTYPNPAGLAFADEVGAYFEGMGHSRLAGRVLGWLLVCEPPEQTASEIASILGVSRSAISPVTQYLTYTSMIERRKASGARELRYRIVEDGWARMQSEGMQRTAEFRKLVERTLDALSGRDPVTNRRLCLVRDFHAFLERELPMLAERWLAECSKERK